MSSTPAETGRDSSRPDPLAERLSAAVAPRYRLGPRLGRGGMAVVYNALDTALDREVAIKVIDPSRIYEDGSIARFRSEAIAAAALRHPHIVAIHDWGEQGDLLWFVMDKLSGGSLRELMRRDPRLPAPRVARLLGQVSGALHHAHEQGVLHRDINPANILLDDQGNAFVSDFGIAKVLGASTLTETGAAVGTAQYMSPEQLLHGGEVSVASDQFSLGVTAFEMLSGSRPFPADTPAQLAVALDRGKARTVRSVVPECPRHLAVLVDRMLARRPGDRWPAMSDVQQIAEEIAVTGSAPSMRGMARPGARRRGLRSGAVMMVLVLLGLAGWNLMARLDVPPESETLSAIEAGQGPEFVGGAGVADDREDTVGVELGDGPTEDSAPPSPTQLVNGQGDGMASAAATQPRPIQRSIREAQPVLVDSGTVSPPPPVRTGPAHILVGSRGVNVYIYVNDRPPVRLGALTWIPVNEFGTVQLSYRSQGCRVLREAVELRPGDSLTVGFRNPDCS